MLKNLKYLITISFFLSTRHSFEVSTYRVPFELSAYPLPSEVIPTIQNFLQQLFLFSNFENTLIFSPTGVLITSSCRLLPIYNSRWHPSDIRVMRSFRVFRLRTSSQDLLLTYFQFVFGCRHTFGFFANRRFFHISADRRPSEVLPTSFFFNAKNNYPSHTIHQS